MLHDWLGIPFEYKDNDVPVVHSSHEAIEDCEGAAFDPNSNLYQQYLGDAERTPRHVCTVYNCKALPHLAATISCKGNLKYPDRCITHFSEVDGSNKKPAGASPRQEKLARTRVVIHEIAHSAGPSSQESTLCHFGADSPMHCNASPTTYKCVMGTNIETYYWAEPIGDWPIFEPVCKHEDDVREHIRDHVQYWPELQ